MDKKIYRCAECGAAITNKEYLRSVKDNELKFCSTECDKRAWRRGVYEFAKTYNRKQKKPATPPPPKKPRGHRVLTNEDRLEILEMAEKGYSASKIKTLTGRAAETIKRVVEDYATLTMDDITKILEMEERGMSPSEISNLIGRTTATVIKVTKDYELVYEEDEDNKDD